MIEGGCLCAEVRYRIQGEPRSMTHCHCSMCRKAHGASFATWVTASTDEFRWVAGEELIARFSASPDFERTFCRVCGSNLPLYFAKMDELAIPAGSLDDDPGIRLTRHIFVGSKAPWVEIDEDLECFDEYSPSYA